MGRDVVNTRVFLRHRGAVLRHLTGHGPNLGQSNEKGGVAGTRREEGRLAAPFWAAPEAGLEPATRSLSQPGASTSGGAAEATTGPDVPPVERQTSEKSPPKPSPRKRRA